VGSCECYNKRSVSIRDLVILLLSERMLATDQVLHGMSYGELQDDDINSGLSGHFPGGTKTFN
jgi:hypothetical protein